MIGIAVVGYGRWGESSCASIADTDGLILRAVSDLSPIRGKRAAARYSDAIVTNDWKSVVSHPNVDAVIVATSVPSRFQVALYAIRAGKHVLTGSPITTSSDQAALLIQEAAHRKVILMVDHSFVYSPAISTIRSLIECGEIGDIKYYDSVRYNPGKTHEDVNVILGLAANDVAILDFIVPELPRAVSAHAFKAKPGVFEGVANLTFYYDSGMTAHISANWLAPLVMRQSLIAGSRRMIVYNDLLPREKVKIYDVDLDVGSQQVLYRQLLSHKTGSMWAPSLATKEALQSEIEEFADCILANRTPLSSGLNGLRVLETLETATRSARLRGAPIELRGVEQKL
jgi:predicted dehydrogenase